MTEPDRDEIVHLSERAVGAPPPFVQGLSETLTYNALAWPNFERLVKRVASRCLGWDKVRIYGSIGQSQYGIDVIGIQPDDTAGALQAKKYESFDEGDLVKAVEAFDPDRLPIKGVTRLIIVTSVATNRRQIVEKLTELQKSVDAVMEFWDATNLDDELRGNADLVYEFFGPEAARLFCGYVPPVVAPVAPERADVAALVARGPERMPEVAAALARAANLEASDPTAAASAYAEAQVALNGARFPAHARALDTARAAALMSSGDQEGATLLLTNAYWEALSLGENDTAHVLAGRIADLAKTDVAMAVSQAAPAPAEGAATDVDDPAKERDPGTGRLESSPNGGEERPSAVVLPEASTSSETATTDAAKRDVGSSAAAPSRKDGVVAGAESGDATAQVRSAASADDDAAGAGVGRDDGGDDVAPTFVDRAVGLIDIAERLLAHPVGTVSIALPLLDLNALLLGVEDTDLRRQIARLTVLVAETSLCNPLDDWAVAHVDDLRKVLAAIATDPGDDFDSLRLQLTIAIAEVSDDWSDLLFAVRTKRYFREDCATISARAALAATMAGDLDAADTRWSDAIEEACLTGHYGDAAEWVFARRNILIAKESWRVDPSSLGRIAHALQQLGGGIRQPTIRRITELAQDRRIDGRELAAALAARDYLRRAYAAGSWRQYSHSNSLLAAAYVASGFYLEAVAHYAAGGDSAKAEEAAAAAGDNWLDCTPLLNTGLTRTRTAAFRVLAAQGDLVPDDRVADVASAAWAEVRPVLLEGVTADDGRLAYLAGLRALGGIADRIDNDLAAELVPALQPLVAREPGHYRHSDEWHVQILAGVGDTHADLADACLTQLIDLGTSDTGAATYVRRRALNLLAKNLETVAPLLRAKANEDSPAAASLLLLLGVSNATSPEDVEAARLRLLVEPTCIEGVRHFGVSVNDDVRKVTDLPPDQRREIVEVLLRNAENEPPPAWHADDYLASASDLALALGDEPDLFARALALAEAPLSDVPPPFTDNPLSAVRMKGLDTDPRPAAALLAARLASSDEQRREVQQVCKTLLLWNAGNDRLLGWALRLSMGGSVADVLPILATRTEPVYRAHAAVAWVETGCADPGIGLRLAQDPSGRVRRELADAISDMQPPLGDVAAKVTRVLVDDPRHSIRRLVRPLPVDSSS